MPVGVFQVNPGMPAEVFQINNLFGYQELLKLVPVEEALSRALPLVEQVPVEEVPLAAGWQRVLAEDVTASASLPGFARSTVDGFAVRAADTFGAAEGAPALLRLAGQIQMGQEVTASIRPGEAMAIPTGGMMPAGADAVIMVEHATAIDAQTLETSRRVAPLENVIGPDEDLREGELVLSRGRILRAQDLGVLAAVGRPAVRVYRRPRVGILSTGDEVVDPASPVHPGQVRDANGYALIGLVQAAGCEPVFRGVVPDELPVLRARAAELFAACDALLISGGSSVGTRDHTRQVIDELGKPGVLVHGLAIRPGKPTILGVAGGKPAIGLPGHPVSAMVVFDILARPLLERMSGLAPGEQAVTQAEAVLARNVASTAGREDYIRVKLVEREGALWAEPILGKSGLITTLVRAGGLLRIPAEKDGFQAGERVTVRLFGSVW